MSLQITYLQSGLQQPHTDGSQRQDCYDPMSRHHRSRWDEHEAQVHVTPTKGDHQQDGIKRQVILQELEARKSEHAQQDTTSGYKNQGNLHHKKDLKQRDRLIFAGCINYLLWLWQLYSSFCKSPNHL